MNEYFKIKRKKNIDGNSEELEKPKNDLETTPLNSPSKLSTEKMSPEGNPENNQIQELFFQLETQKVQIEDLKATIQKLKNENQNVKTFSC